MLQKTNPMVFQFQLGSQVLSLVEVLS
jgi:hypothetical protein